MPSSGGDGEFDMKQSRLDNPSGWIELTRYETVRLLIDALLEAPPDYKFNKSELERRTGLSREAIRQHLPQLLELGVVEEIEGEEWAEYRLNSDGKVTRELLELNSAVNSVLSGEPKDLQEQTLPQVTLEEFTSDTEGGRNSPLPRFRDVDNSKPRRNDNNLIDQPPTGVSTINAD